MDDPGGVHVVQPAQDLVQEELEVGLLEVLPRVDNVVQVLPTRGQKKGNKTKEEGKNYEMDK